MWLATMLAALAMPIAGNEIAATATHRVKRMIRTRVCQNRNCQIGPDCVSYLTPVAECYNPQSLFPNGSTWGDMDVLDQLVENAENKNYDDENNRRTPEFFTRTLFGRSTHGTCIASPTNDDEIFTLPLRNVCVGPFGKPRPWGEFALLVEPTNGTATTDI